MLSFTYIFILSFALDPAVYAQQNDELLNASARLTAEKDAIRKY